jgi:hypothetical protein
VAGAKLTKTAKVQRVVSPMPLKKRMREERLMAWLHVRNGFIQEKDMMKVKKVKITCDGGSTTYVRDFDKYEENEVKKRDDIHG